MEILQVLLTSVFSVFYLFILTKLIGHRQMSQLGLFDYITGITIGSIAAELATELEDPVKMIVAMLVYAVITLAFSIITSKSQRLRKYISGVPVIIFQNGRLYRENMKKAKLDLSEFLVMCRQAGYFCLDSIEMAVYEFNGKMSFLPKSGSRPVTPADLSVPVSPASITTEIIMDGQIIEKNLKRIGLDIRWLKKQLESQKKSDPRQVFFAVCDNNKNLIIYDTAGTKI